ncbi:MAG: hypothetical protein IJT14_02615 [Rickettsiales bacterium]|nr:hypothetical protein [Rickettsiales bacterium]
MSSVRILTVFFVYAICITGCIFTQQQPVKTEIKQTINTDRTVLNDSGNILDGETIYPEQVKKVIARYNKKYNIDISFAENKQDFLDILGKKGISKFPYAIFQYNKNHKYGFIFVKYRNTDYCVCVDTIPTLSEYTKDLFLENGNLFIKFNGRKYRAIMFGENLQKASKGCGYFTLGILKQLLKNNKRLLFEVIDTERKYGTGDKTKRDEAKKSCIRGVSFDVIKKTAFAPEIYKYAQTMSLQSNFDDRKVGNKQINFKIYRNFYSTQVKDKQMSTKIFQVAQKYKDLAGVGKNNVEKYKEKLFTLPDSTTSMAVVKLLNTYKKYFGTIAIDISNP